MTDGLPGFARNDGISVRYDERKRDAEATSPAFSSQRG